MKKPMEELRVTLEKMQLEVEPVLDAVIIHINNTIDILVSYDEDQNFHISTFKGNDQLESKPFLLTNDVIKYIVRSLKKLNS